MDPSSQACPNLACPDKGQVGRGNIRIHARADARYRCRTCGRTFAATTNTPLYRLHHPTATMTVVLTLLLHGCPIPAVVAAFGFDERTVRAWLHKAGAHAVCLHEQLVTEVSAHQVQADEVRVRVRGGAVWAAVALDVGSRLWLATAVARRRDGALIHLLLRRTSRGPGEPGHPPGRGWFRQLRHGGADPPAGAGADRAPGTATPAVA
ncbi:MAG: hypothetical protein NVSMB65_21530 [Chloroflexota bacterium]